MVVACGVKRVFCRWWVLELWTSENAGRRRVRRGRSGVWELGAPRAAAESAGSPGGVPRAAEPVGRRRCTALGSVGVAVSRGGCARRWARECGGVERWRCTALGSVGAAASRGGRARRLARECGGCPEAGCARRWGARVWWCRVAAGALGARVWWCRAVAVHGAGERRCGGVERWRCTALGSASAAGVEWRRCTSRGSAARAAPGLAAVRVVRRTIEPGDRVLTGVRARR
jgi:hypothetical protein